MRKTIFLLLAMLLALSILFSGCKGTSPSLTDTIKESTAPTTQAAFPSSLDILRQNMEQQELIYAVAYLGYHDTLDSDLPVEPHAVLLSEAPQLCREHPFLLEIPEERVIGGRGDLFCIVPLNAEATIAVSKGIWDEQAEQYVYTDFLYSGSGEPIFLFCNDTGWEPDTQVHIYGPSGAVLWYPLVDDNQCAAPTAEEPLFLDFSPYREMLTEDYGNMKGEWVLPTAQMLANTSWEWNGYRKDGLDTAYQVTFGEGTLSVCWNDGIDTEDHIFPDAQWQLTQEGDFAVLSVDFRELAGVLRYNLLYHEDYELLYFGMDVLQEEMPIGWEPLCRYLSKPDAPDPSEMVGTWELEWTEVEGDRNTAQPNSQTLEITVDAEGIYRISYLNRDFPAKNYTNKAMSVLPMELYYGCGNDQWLATVDYSDQWGSEYRITLLPDGTLLMQNYMITDGAPMVGYCSFRKMPASS